MKLRFIETPSPGSVEVMVDDQVYVLAGSEPYTRKDGEVSALLLWSTSCADCGDETLVTSSRSMSAKLTRRCRQCIERRKAERSSARTE